MGIYPNTYVYNEGVASSPKVIRPGIAGRIAVIGAFNTEETTPQSFDNLKEAQKTLGTDSTFNGCDVLPILMEGATSILAVNFTTWSGSGNSKTADKSLTPSKLSDALAKIKHEEFDILFVAEELLDTTIPIISEFLAEIYEVKNPACYTGAINRSTKAAYLTTLNLAGDYCAGLISQQVIVNGNLLSLLESSAYYASVIASLNVGNSMTKKTLPNVTGITPAYTFEDGDDGLAYLTAGMTIFECVNSLNDEYCVVNSEQPNGLDLYIVRSENYIIRQFQLRQYLGDKNKPKTLNEVKQELDRVKKLCVETLDLVEDINYTATKTAGNCLDIYLETMKFASVLTTINMHILIEVD